MPNRAEIVAAARGWLGTPWRHQGRVKGVGVDCLGLLIGVAREVGYSPPDRADYPRRPSGRELMAILDDKMAPVAEGRAGDLVAWEVDGQPQHVGILTELEAGMLGVVHAYALRPNNRVIEQRFSPTWPGPLAGYWAFPGVSD